MNRFLSLILLLALAAVGIAPASAQSPDPLCISLADEDCTRFINALDQMKAIGSVNNQAFSIILGGSGGASTGNSTNFTGNGPMQISEEGLISAFDFQVKRQGSEASPDQTGELVWLEEMLYVGSPAETGGLIWTGTPTDNDEMALIMDLISGNLLLDVLEEPGVAITLRGEDTELDGQPIIVFESDIDLVTMLLAPRMLNLLQTALASMPSDLGSDAGSGMGLDQLQGADLAGAIPLLSLLFTQDTFQTVIWVGAEDGLVHHVEILVDWVIDPSMIDPTQSPATFQFEFVTDLDQHGAAPSITAPSDFTLQEELNLDLGVSLEDIMGGGASAGDLPLAEQFAVESPLAYGETVTGELSASNPQDVWGFTASAGDVITITLNNVNAQSVLDTQLFLRDPEGIELASNDDHGTDNAELLFSDSVIDAFTIPADGEYRIVATWLAPVREGAYELSVSLAE